MFGRGVFTWADGRSYYGQYENDKKQGYGEYYWADSSLKAYKGQWADGRQHGNGAYFNHSEIKIGNWVEGKRQNWLN